MQNVLLQLTIGCLLAAFASAACPSNEWRAYRVGGYSINDICNFGFPGSRAVSVHDIDVNSFLSHDMLSGFDAWMGLYRQAGYSGFHWEDGTAFDFSFWVSTPSGTDERCANINQNSATGQWGNLSCGTQLRFLCATYET